MPQKPGQQKATDAVAAELADRGWTHVDLSLATVTPGTNESAVDLGTIGDFLAYNRWPKLGTQGRFEKALGWPAGTIRLIAVGKAERPSADASVADPESSAEEEIDPRDIEDDNEAVVEFIRQRQFRRGQRDVSPNE